MKEEVVTGRKSTKPLSAGIKTESFIFVSGMAGLKPGTKEPVGPDVESQTVKTLENIEAVLKAAGATLNDVVKSNIYLKSRDDYDRFNETYRTFFSEPYPSRTTVYCDLNYDILVEIDVIALRPNKGE